MRMTYSSRIGADLRYQVMREGLDGEPRNSNGKGISARDSRARMRARAFRAVSQGWVCEDWRWDEEICTTRCS